jgi:Bacterial Ig-like domain (group 3)/FG-GAP-like repeat
VGFVAILYNSACHKSPCFCTEERRTIQPPICTAHLQQSVPNAVLANLAERLNPLRRLFRFPATAFVLFALTNLADGQTPAQTASTTLTANPATITIGASVTLNATVQPEIVQLTPGAAFTKPSGAITFLDGNTQLNAAPIALAPNIFASQTFQQLFGLPSAIFTQQNIGGELTGDLNGDGIADLLIYAYVGGPAPALYAQAFLSDGKGGYSPAILQTPGFSSTVSIPVLVDLNGDGKLDLLDGLLVSFGKGDGTFAQAVPVPFLSSGFQAAYAADLNGDGKPDIIAINSVTLSLLTTSLVQPAITVFLNGGNGSFAAAGTFPIIPPVGGNSEQILVSPPAFADLNGDGKLDMVTQTTVIPLGNAGGVPYVAVLLNAGDGTFGSPAQLTITSNELGINFTYDVGFGDLNGDGNQDLILSAYDELGDGLVMIFLGNLDGAFDSPSYLTLPLKSLNFIVEDANLDGHLDLVFGDGTLAIGKGDGTFTLGPALFPPPASMGLLYPTVQMNLAGNPAPSIVFLALPSTPAPAAIFTPQTSGSATLSLSTLAVGTHTLTAHYSGDANYGPSTSAPVTVTVNQAASTTAVTSSTNPSFAGQSVTLTANVASSGPAPTGTVIFTSGSTTLGTIPVSGGSAAYTTSSFISVGTQTITASYSGDSNTQASSATLSQVVSAAFALAPGSGTTTLTVPSGQSVSAPINVTGATGFSGQVIFACSGLPANAVCSFSPATITVAGTPAVPTLLTVNTAASTTASQIHDAGDLGSAAYGLALASLLLFCPDRRRWSVLRITLLSISILALLVPAGCGGGTGSSGSASSGGGTGGSPPAPPAPPATAAGTYTFMVTATSGKVVANSTYTLVVQ